LSSHQRKDQKQNTKQPNHYTVATGTSVKVEMKGIACEIESRPMNTASKG
jgi:hypothetical protein